MEEPLQPSEFPNGYSLMYYNLFEDLLSPHFLSAYNAAGSGAEFTVNLLRAHITVMAKEGKDPLLCQHYWLISLLNIDLKLFTKI